MQVKYYAEDDACLLITDRRGSTGGTLREDFRVILEFADDNDGRESITRVDILDVSRFLPLCPEKGYSADTDVLTLGDEPSGPFRTVECGDFVGYWQEFDDGSEWDIVALDIRQASKHLAPAIAGIRQDTDTA